MASMHKPDVMFLQQMIEHHQEAVKMSKGYLGHPDAQQTAKVTDLAGKIIAAQTPEIALMSGWLKDAGEPLSSGVNDDTQMAMSSPMTQPHGFIWPDGLPSCLACERMANDPIHVTPGPANNGRMRQMAASMTDPHNPVVSHVYSLATLSLLNQISCQGCGGGLRDSLHPAGTPAGWVGSAAHRHIMAEPPMLAHDAAFVQEVDNKVVLISRGQVLGAEHSEQMSELMRERAGSAGPFQWVMGRYVQADVPNRNAAFWATADLELGQPTIASGPINWLHQERHIIGSIAATELVLAAEQSAAAASVGNHIVALGALWPWVYPQETAVVAQASEAGSLWYSMECISREVACLAQDCTNVMPYRSYVLEKASRCEHMNDGAPRRFVDPTFRGAGIIVPPVQPGWSGADLRTVMPQAAQMVERQAAAFTGVPAADAEAVVAQAILSAQQ